MDPLHDLVNKPQNTWPEEEKQVFGPYYDGQDYIFGDPLAIHRRLFQETAGEADHLIEEAWGDKKVESCLAFERLYPAVIAAFLAKPFDKATGTGLREDQAISLLRLFIDWLGKKKGSTRT